MLKTRKFCTALCTVCVALCTAPGAGPGGHRRPAVLRAGARSPIPTLEYLAPWWRPDKWIIFGVAPL